MKMHYRLVTRVGKSRELSMIVPCGTNAHLTRSTTKDVPLVTCKRCLAAAQKLDPK